MLQKNFFRLRRPGVAESRYLLCLALALCCMALSQQGKKDPAPASVTGHYEGTAKDKTDNVITVAMDLTEKDGALSGMINSSHGDFSITGTHKGEAVALEFDADGEPGTISLRLTEDRLVGTWSAGEDGGPLDVKRAAKQEEPPKGKS